MLAKSVPVEYRSQPAQSTGPSADSSTTTTSSASGFACISRASAVATVRSPDGLHQVVHSGKIYVAGHCPHPYTRWQVDVVDELADLAKQQCFGTLGREARGRQPVSKVLGRIVGVGLPFNPLVPPGEEVHLPGDPMTGVVTEAARALDHAVRRAGSLRVPAYDRPVGILDDASSRLVFLAAKPDLAVKPLQQLMVAEVGRHWRKRITRPRAAANRFPLADPLTEQCQAVGQASANMIIAVLLAAHPLCHPATPAGGPACGPSSRGR